jgi:hypothetical protein
MQVLLFYPDGKRRIPPPAQGKKRKSEPEPEAEQNEGRERESAVLRDVAGRSVHRGRGGRMVRGRGRGRGRFPVAGPHPPPTEVPVDLCHNSYTALGRK